MDGYIGASQMLRPSTFSLQTRMDGGEKHGKQPYQVPSLKICGN